MAKINVDGKVFEVDPSKNLLEEILSNQQDLPYFCWHPSMGSVGSCRQCAIIEYANDEDQRGRQVMACMTSPRDGARYSIEKAAKFRAQAIESLMTNHPHDCPVCEEGGECHLQDMTVMSGHTYRRYDGKKATHTNQYLGPFIGHEMNRCITCYRCVRFYKDYAGGTDFSVQASHNNTYFGRFQDGAFDSEFSDPARYPSPKFVALALHKFRPSHRGRVVAGRAKATSFAQLECCPSRCGEASSSHRDGGAGQCTDGMPQNHATHGAKAGDSSSFRVM